MTEDEARKYAADCMRLGVPIAIPFEREDGTWGVEMRA